MDAGSNDPADGRDWMAAPLSDLVQHILDTHHRYLKEALPRLSRLSQEAVQIQKTFENLRAELESHMWKEEMVLFPLVLGLEEARMNGRPAPPAHCGSIRNPIRVMEQEHSNATRTADSPESWFESACESADCSSSYPGRLGGGSSGPANVWTHPPVLYSHWGDGPHGFTWRPRYDGGGDLSTAEASQR